MAFLVTALVLGTCAAAGIITEAPSAITPAPDAPCPLTNSIPVCGISCLLSAGSAVGCSNALDLGCQCKAASEIHSRAAPCVLSKCGPEKASTLESVAQAICTQCNV